MEWEREKTYIREDALEEGREQGAQQKAIEDALTLIRDYNATPEEAAEKMGAPLELVLDALKAPSPAQA